LLLRQGVEPGLHLGHLASEPIELAGMLARIIRMRIRLRLVAWSALVVGPRRERGEHLHGLAEQGHIGPHLLLHRLESSGTKSLPHLLA
jgi:hypothetical protein